MPLVLDVPVHHAVCLQVGEIKQPAPCTKTDMNNRRHEAQTVKARNTYFTSYCVNNVRSNKRACANSEVRACCSLDVLGIEQRHTRTNTTQIGNKSWTEEGAGH
jgi:hypothetical protein